MTLLRRLASSQRPGALLKVIYRLPVPLLRARLGWLLAGRVVLLEHIGRRTGRCYFTAVEVIGRDRQTGAVTVASGYGRGADWYRNLRARPAGAMVLGARRREVDARQLSLDEGADIMVEYARRHPRAAPRVARMLGYVVDGTDADYAALGRALRFVRLVPRPR